MIVWHLSEVPIFLDALYGCGAYGYPAGDHQETVATGIAALSATATAPFELDRGTFPRKKPINYEYGAQVV